MWTTPSASRPQPTREGNLDRLRRGSARRLFHGRDLPAARGILHARNHGRGHRCSAAREEHREASPSVPSGEHEFVLALIEIEIVQAGSAKAPVIRAGRNCQDAAKAVVGGERYDSWLTGSRKIRSQNQWLASEPIGRPPMRFFRGGLGSETPLEFCQ